MLSSIEVVVLINAIQQTQKQKVGISIFYYKNQGNSTNDIVDSCDILKQMSKIQRFYVKTTSIEPQQVKPIEKNTSSMGEEVEFMKSIALNMMRLFCFTTIKPKASSPSDKFIKDISIEKKKETSPSVLQLQILSKKPKKPTSSFVFYFQEQVRSKNHPSNQRQIDKLATIVSKQWKELPQSVKDPYEKMASKSKENYRIQMDKYQSLYGDELAKMKRHKIVKKPKRRNIYSRKRQITNAQLSIDQQPKSPHTIEEKHPDVQVNAEGQDIKVNPPVHSATKICDKWERQMQPLRQNLCDSSKEQSSKEKTLLSQTDEEIILDKSEAEKQAISKEGSSESDLNSIDYSSSETYIEGQQLEQQQSLPQSSEFINLKDYGNDYEKQRKEQKFKISHKPKGPATCFFIFYNEIVQVMKRENSQMKGSDYAKLASDKWGALTNEEKQPYREMEKQKRKIYDEEMAIYMKEYPEQAAQNLQQKKDRKMRKKAKIQ